MTDRDVPSRTQTGRPKGARNEADLLEQLLRTKVRASIGRGRPKKRTVAEVIVRLQFAKAAAGDKKARKCVFDFLDKIGLGTDVTSEERERRTIKLARPAALDEFDLYIAPAREKERQQAYADLDRENPLERRVSAPVRSADELADNGQIGEAVTLYLNAEAAGVDRRPPPGPNDPVAHRDGDRPLARIGLLADRFLLEGKFAAARACVDKAVASDGSRPTWIALIGAHAEMLLGRTQEARKFYLAFKSNKTLAHTHWENIILQDFGRLRRAGHSSPLMPQIEKALFDSGWTTDAVKMRPQDVPIMTGDDQRFVEQNPEHLETAAILSKHNRLDDAAVLYRKIIETLRAALVHRPDDIGTRGTFDSAVLYFAVLAMRLILAGRFDTALECINELVTLAPHDLSLQATRAHALMFIGRTKEAEIIYFAHRGEQIGGEPWENFIGREFDALRGAGRSDRLMDTIRRLFEKDEAPIVPDPELADAAIEFVQSTGSNESQALPVPHPVNADDLASGDRLLQGGKLEEATVVYRRRLKICESKLANGRVNMQALDDRQRAVDRLSDVAFCWVLQKQFQKAIAVTDEATNTLPNASSARVRRAHALMLLDRPDEARAIYKQYWNGKASPDATWRDAIRKDFDAIRSHVRSHPLMDELERMPVTSHKLIR